MSNVALDQHPCKDAEEDGGICCGVMICVACEKEKQREVVMVRGNTLVP
jgi:hypothetical protein